MISIKRFKTKSHKIHRSPADESGITFSCSFDSNCNWPSDFNLKGGEYASGEFFVFASSDVVSLDMAHEARMYYGTGDSMALAELDAFSHYIKEQQVQ